MSKHLYRTRYALAILHVHVMIYKDGDLLTAEEKTVPNKEKILSLLTVVCFPEEVAISQTQGIKQRHT